MRRGLLLSGVCLAAVALCVVAQNPPTANEGFETQPPNGWHLPPTASIQMVGRGHALVFNGPGMAATPLTCGQNFTLTCRVQVQNGTASIAFCISGTEGQPQLYRLILNVEETVLQRTAGRGAPQDLGAGATKLAGNPWAQLRVVRNGGQIQVSIDNQLVATVQDPNPLPAGGLEIGCLHGAAVAYDDIALSGGGFVVTPAIPINIPGTATPGQPPQPGGAPVVRPMIAEPLPGPEQPTPAPLQGTMQPQPGQIMQPMVAQPFPGTQQLQPGQIMAPMTVQPFPGTAQPGAGPTQALLDPGALGQVSQPAPPHVMQLVSRPPTRAEMVQALLANPQTAALLQSIPRPPNLPPQTLASVGTSGTPTHRAAVVPAGPATMPGNPGSVQVSQQVLIQMWEGGVSFTPVIARPAASAGAAAVPLGREVIEHLQLGENLAYVAAANVVEANFSWHSARIASVGLSLPPGQAAYMVAVRIRGQTEGAWEAPASWVNGPNPIVAVSTKSVGSVHQQLQLVPLQDGSGYVGVSSFGPSAQTGQHSVVGPGWNAYVHVAVMCDSNTLQQRAGQPNPPSGRFLFGGVTVTRL